MWGKGFDTMRFLWLIILVVLTFSCSTKQLSLMSKHPQSGQSIHLFAVYFEFGRGYLLDEKQPQLDSLVNFLKVNKKVKVEVAVHSDFRGSTKMNLELTQNRALCVKEYLVEKGISENRVVAIGYGESKPLIPEDEWEKILNANPHNFKLKDKNRRISVTIL